MPVALILSSFVAASRIGGGAQQYVLAAHRIDPVLAPTVLFGRNPATGAAGDVTEPDVLRRMLADIEADAIFGEVDLVIAGYFAIPEQVEIAASLLERIRAAAPKPPIVLVDPIMGDDPKGLYVHPEVAEAVATRLVPLADWITPNLWELGRLAGAPILDVAGAIAACRTLGRRALVTSLSGAEGEIGLLYCDADEAVLFTHQRLAHAPNGTGDLVTASFGAGLIEGLAPRAAAERAARVAAETVQVALEWGVVDLPIVALAEQLVNPTANVRIKEL
ncbi:PfkB family carbohydrate kinase [Phenylobacterium sp. LjRoot225]|uniref:PfkB family carbohydrate kinase n=1 Tax=Phenylobacterium sp. LjRoot225 TaxID=3342285 RepID=UPI003ECE49A7